MGFFKQLSTKLKLQLGSLFYLKYVLQAFLYSHKRDHFERQYAPSLPSAKLIQPGKLLQAEATDRGARFYFEQAELEIRFLVPDLVQVDWFPGIPPIPYAIARQEWSVVETTIEQVSEHWTVSSTALKVSVSVDGGLTFYNCNGQTLREELPPQRHGERWVHCSRLRQEEHIYGLGERASTLNLRSAKDKQQRSYRMWNSDPGGYGSGVDPIYICIPIYLGLHSLGSYLVFYENSFDAKFTFADIATAEFAGGSLRYYIMAGEPPQLLERYTELTGRSPLPPRWALGYHQSRWGFRNEATIRRELKTFQTHNLPLSAFHLDIDCQVGHRAFTIDPQRFPRLTSFTQELAELGVRLITINNPGIKYSRASNLFLEGQVLEAFCTYPNGELAIAPVWPGRTVFPDFTNPKVRAWWTRQYAYLLDVGVAGFWHDMNEPAMFVLWGNPSLAKVVQHCFEGRGGDHREAHNLYGLLEAEAAYQSIRQYRPQQRPFIVSRSGWAGLQRYAWTWTGDTASTWETLRQTVATVVGLGLSGIPYSGPDIGGFQGNPSAELYLRWFQMATFLTFYRTHVANNVQPRAPWTYGEPYLSLVRQFLQLRYRLLPYLYTLTWEAAQKGYPPVRPVFWSDWTDQSLWNLEDAFCLGDALLVCPVVQAGARSRTVPLPKGRWYNFWNDTVVEGGKEVQLEAPLEQIPLLVRAGGILPMEESGQLILHLYPPEQGMSEGYLYSDAGDGYGESRLDRFQMIRSDQGLELMWEQQGSYAFHYQSMWLHVHGIQIQQAWIDGKSVAVQEQQLQCQTFRQIYLRVIGHD
ncbi:MAG: glycoside hydrolase family 31 protein [Chroococcidiopsidaceae cyanobacterium CP_BM_ER_R8_30]|nr:glycoside hydrolase family 31 protein [Chroococcidiopsidaceae cyanobacterium CP_BM_ER_R8_30]